MGHPGDNPAGYTAASPLARLESLERPILVAHGELDDRVHRQAVTSSWSTALEDLGKTYEYVTYPTEGHGLSGSVPAARLLPAPGAIPRLAPDGDDRPVTHVGLPPLGGHLRPRSGDPAGAIATNQTGFGYSMATVTGEETSTVRLTVHNRSWGRCAATGSVLPSGLAVLAGREADAERQLEDRPSGCPASCLDLAAPSLDLEGLRLGSAVGDVVDIGGGAAPQGDQEELDRPEIAPSPPSPNSKVPPRTLSRPETGEPDALDGHRTQRVVGHAGSFLPRSMPCPGSGVTAGPFADRPAGPIVSPQRELCAGGGTAARRRRTGLPEGAAVGRLPHDHPGEPLISEPEVGACRSGCSEPEVPGNRSGIRSSRVRGCERSRA